MRVARALRAGISLACTLATAGPSGAAIQAPSATPSAPPLVQFRAGTSIVLLDIVVRDKSGRPLRDLTSVEVQILENGEHCEIQSFRRVEAGPPPGSGPAAPAAAAPPATATERIASGVNLVSLVFDTLAGEDRPTAIRAANDFVTRFLRGGEREQAAVFTVGRALEMVQGFTTDPEAVRRAIALATSSPARDKAVTRDAIRAAREADQAASNAVASAPELGSAADPSRQRVVADPMEARFRAAIAKMLRATDAAQRYQQGSDTLRPLLALASAQSTLPGRKTLLFFSPGLEVPEPVQDLYRSAVSAANRANVSVYAVDVRGLRTQSDAALAGDALRQSTGAAIIQQQTAGETAADIVATDRALESLHLNAQQALASLAEETGGFLLANANEFGAGMDRVAADIGGYYAIAYTPARAVFDGAFRKIEVRLARKDAVVQSRSGYFARPLAEDDLQPYEAPLIAALSGTAASLDAGPTLQASTSSGPSPAGPAHRAAVIRLADAGPFPEVLLLIEVPRESVAPAVKDTVQAPGRFAMLGLVRDARGLVVARLSHEAAVDASGPGASRGMPPALLVDRAIRLAPGHYVFETAVQEVPAGRIGTRRTAFDVPDVGSGPILGSLAMAQAVPNSSREAPLPLVAGASGAVPTLGRPFPEGTPEVAIFFTAHIGAGSEAPSLSLEYRRDGQPFARDMPALPAPDATGRVTFLGRVPSALLAPGRYEIWVRLTQGDAEATEATSFVITPRPRAPASATAAGSQRKLRDARAPDVPLATILDRAAAYVARYAETFRNVLAEELYRQWLVQAATGQTTPRTLRSELVFVKVPGSLPWGTFRDVFELDGRTLKDRQGRLEKLFGRPDPDTLRQAQEILKEGSRYNLGLSYRNVNSPTLAMLLLLPENQSRLELERKGERTVGGFRCVEVVFRELASPTLIRDQWNNDVRSHGRFWIDGTRGAVLRTEIEYDLATNSVEDPEDRKAGSVATEYRLEPGLDVLVPDSMKELYRLGPTRIEGTARYSKYRRFEVTTDWSVAKDPK